MALSRRNCADRTAICAAASAREVPGFRRPITITSAGLLSDSAVCGSIATVRRTCGVIMIGTNTSTSKLTMVP